MTTPWKMISVTLLLMACFSVQARYCIKGACIESLQPHYTAIFSTCPPISMLSRNGMYWGAPGGWTTYNPSFITKITHFVAAQWQGVNLGSVMCVYTGDQGESFPVVLQQMTNAALAPQPFGASWYAINSPGIRNCMSRGGEPLTVLDCAFITVSEPSENPYEQLQFFNKDGSRKVPLGEINVPAY